MKKSTERDKKIVHEIMLFLSRMGQRLENDFPKYKEQITRCFVIVAANRWRNEYGAEAAADILVQIAMALEDPEDAKEGEALH